MLYFHIAIVSLATASASQEGTTWDGHSVAELQCPYLGSTDAMDKV
jgi:hypothetical protein